MALRRTAGIAVLALTLGLLAVGPAHAADAQVDIPDFVFDPDQVSVGVGDSVTWTNNHFEPHTVTADDGSYEYWLNPGDSVTHTYTEDAYEPYFCELHGAPGGLGMSGAVVVGSAQAPPAPNTSPLSASDNVGSAIAWSQRSFPNGADTALLGRDDVFADSLSAGAAQGLLDAPLLLTPSNTLADRTRDELRRLGVDEVVIFGGTAAIGPGVVDALRAEGYEVRRMRGSTRVGTAVNATARLMPDASSAILARAFGDPGDPTRAFADSLGAGAMAAMTGQPVLLTTTDTLSPETRDYLASSAIGYVTIVGGSAAVSEAVEAELEAMGIDVERVFGPNRFATAVAMLEVTGPRPVFTVIDGESPNAWAAGFPAASAGYPVLLTQSGGLPPETLSTVVMFGSFGVRMLCGPFLAASVCGRVRDAASAAPFFSSDTRFFVLEGRQEPGGGNDEVSGTGAVFPTDSSRTLCYEYELFGDLGEITAAHIHKGARGENGPPVITLSTEIERMPDGIVRSCAFDQDAAVVSDILENHGDYYVNVHSTEFPNGAVRGQLAVLTGAAPHPLMGEQETTGGEAGAEAFAVVIFTDFPGEMCVLFFMFPGVSSTTTAAHIHKAPPGEDGPPVVTLRTPPQIGADAGCYQVDQALLDDIRANPGDYYTNVHTERYPGGAIRGQLAMSAEA